MFFQNFENFYFLQGVTYDTPKCRVWNGEYTGENRLKI
jgi:hypothetical protein